MSDVLIVILALYLTIGCVFAVGANQIGGGDMSWWDMARMAVLWLPFAIVTAVRGR